MQQRKGSHHHHKHTGHGAECVHQSHTLGHQRQCIQVVGKEPLYGQREKGEGRGEGVGGE